MQRKPSRQVRAVARLQHFIEFSARSLAWIPIATSPGLAQIVPDTTLPTPSIAELSGNTIAIGGGSRAGNNLFHSFQEFSIPTGLTAELRAADPAALANIFLRVTGDLPSQIDGTIAAPGTADLFLLNPNGITFGAEARLDVGGMLLASSADRLDFTDGTTWTTGAAALTETPLLSISAPLGLQFDLLPEGAIGGEISVLGTGQREILAGDPGSEPLLEQIRAANTNVDVDSLESLFATVGIAGEGLEASPGTAIALVGRGVTLAGGLLRVPEGAIALASPAAGRVNLTGDLAQPLSFGDVSAWNDVRISDVAGIDTSGNSSGNLTIRGENLTFANGAIVFARPLGNGTGSELLLEAEDTIRLEGVGNIDGANQDNALLGGTIGEASGSNITFRAREIRFDDGAVISSITFSGSQGGSVTMEARDRVVMDGDGATGVRCCSRVLADSRGTGSAGNITIETPLLQVTDGAQFASRAFLSGDGGTIAIRATDVELRGAIPIAAVASVPVTNFFGTRFPSGLFTVSRTGSTGNSGSVRIDADRLVVGDLAEIQVTTFGSGQGGDLTLNVRESIAIDSPTGVTLTEPETITVVGDRSFVQRDPSLAAFSELTLISAGATDAGSGGNLTIETGRLDLRNGNILVGTIGTGDAGQLPVTARDGIALDRSTIFSGSFDAGDAGNLQIKAPNLELTNGSLISAATALNGTGVAGSVEIAADSIALRDDSQIAATTERGDGGNLSIDSDLLQLRDASLLTAASRAADLANPGNGGNLSLDSELLVLFDRSQISANALTGSGGNIAIVTQGLYQASGSRITASSAVGFAGVVEVSTPDIDSTPGLVQLSTGFVDADATAIERCGGNGSSFTIPNGAGLPDDPETQVDLPVPTVVRPLPIATENSGAPAAPQPSPLQEARGWSLADGQLRLEGPQSIARTSHCLLPDRDL